MMSVRTGVETCRVCHSANVVFAWDHPNDWDPANPRHYYACESCGTLMDADGAPPSYDSSISDADYETSTPFRFHIEVGAGLGAIAWFVEMVRWVDQKRTGGKGGRFLDIGAGFGFAVSMAKSLGWDAHGLEPSPIGRAGRKMLGIPLQDAYLEDTEFEKASFDYIFSSEVIEHVEDMDQFVRTIGDYLKPDGVILLTTPNGETARRRGEIEPDWVDSISPGFHKNMLGPKGMEILLKRHGFEAVRLFSEGGVTRRKRLIVLAARTDRALPAPGRDLWNEIDPDRLVQPYLHWLVEELDRKNDRSPLMFGAMSRCIEIDVGKARFTDALRTANRFEAILTAMGNPPSEFARIRTPERVDDYFAQVPACAGLFCFFRGMIALRQESDYLAAIRWFGDAFHLLAIERKLPWFVRGHWPQRALHHRGIAHQAANHPVQAAADYERLLAHPEGLPPEVSEAELRKTIAALAIPAPPPAPPAPPPAPRVETIVHVVPAPTPGIDGRTLELLLQEIHNTLHIQAVAAQRTAAAVELIASPFRLVRRILRLPASLFRKRA